MSDDNTKIYVVQVADEYEDTGLVVYAGTDRDQALRQAEICLQSRREVRLITWEQGREVGCETGKPVIEWKKGR